MGERIINVKSPAAGRDVYMNEKELHIHIHNLEEKPSKEAIEKSAKYILRCISEKYDSNAELKPDLRKAISELQRKAYNSGYVPDLIESMAYHIHKQSSSKLEDIIKDSDELEELATMTVKDKRYERAIELYEIAFKNDDSNLVYYSGVLSFWLKNYYEAADFFDVAININPRDTWAWNNKGVVYSLNKNYHGALDCFNRAIQLNPEDKKALYNKYVALNAINNDKANKTFDKVFYMLKGNNNYYPPILKKWGYKGYALRRLGKLNKRLK